MIASAPTRTDYLKNRKSPVRLSYELAGAGARGGRVRGGGDCREIPVAIAEYNNLVAIFISRTKNADANGC